MKLTEERDKLKNEWVITVSLYYREGYICLIYQYPGFVSGTYCYHPAHLFLCTYQSFSAVCLISWAPNTIQCRSRSLRDVPLSMKITAPTCVLVLNRYRTLTPCESAAFSDHDFVIRTVRVLCHSQNGISYNDGLYWQSITTRSPPQDVHTCTNLLMFMV